MRLPTTIFRSWNVSVSVDRERVARRFRWIYGRPLYGPAGVPDEWQPVIDDWARLLESLKIADVHAFYLEMCRGTSLTTEVLVLRINQWTPDNERSAPRPGRMDVPPSPADQRLNQAAGENVAPWTFGTLDRDVEAPPRAAFKNRQPIVSTAQLDAKEAPEGTPPAPVQTPAPAGGQAARPVRPPEPWMLSDRPLEDDFAKQDKFQFEDYASALAAFLDHEKTDTPFTMAINAPWGAGKTTLANMIAARLKQRPTDRGEAPHIICWFNAWMHDDAPNLATALVSEVSRTADRHRSALSRLVRPLPVAVLEPLTRTIRRFAIAAIVLVAIVVASWQISDHLEHLDQQRAYESARMSPYQATETISRDASGNVVSQSMSTAESRSREAVPAPAVPNRDFLDPPLGWFHSRIVRLGAFFTALAGIVGGLIKLFASTNLGSFVQSPDKAAEAGVIQSARTRLRQLIEQATRRGNRFVLFVDDLERCKPPRSVDVMDAVSQLLDHKNVVVVLLGDMAAVAAAAQLKYKDLAEIYVPSAGVTQTGPDRGKEAFGRLYLQKIVQFQFDLPIPPPETIRTYMAELVRTPSDGIMADAIAPQREGIDGAAAAT